MSQTRTTCDHCKGGIDGRHEIWCQVYAFQQQVAQQAAAINRLRKTLEIIRALGRYEVGDCIGLADEALRQKWEAEATRSAE